MRATDARFIGRPRLLLLIVGVVAAASAAAILAVAPRSADHQALSDLSLPVILTAGFLDGFNPCAFGVLILFATFALGLAARQSLASAGPSGTPDAGRASRTVLGLGAFFVVGVLVTYFVLGLGLLTAVASFTNFGGNHLPSRIAALIAIGLGLWMVRDILLPDASWKLEAPHALHGRMRDWARTSSPAALFGGGVLIGLCTVPCSGAVYLGVLSLLALQPSAFLGYSYLVLYNFIFVLPLVIILIAASARPTLNRLAHWNLHHKEWVRLALGGGVVIMGLIILATV